MNEEEQAVPLLSGGDDSEDDLIKQQEAMVSAAANTGERQGQGLGLAGPGPIGAREMGDNSGLASIDASSSGSAPPGISPLRKSVSSPSALSTAPLPAASSSQQQAESAQFENSPPASHSSPSPNQALLDPAHLSDPGIQQQQQLLNQTPTSSTKPKNRFRRGSVQPAAYSLSSSSHLQQTMLQNAAAASSSSLPSSSSAASASSFSSPAPPGMVRHLSLMASPTADLSTSEPVSPFPDDDPIAVAVRQAAAMTLNSHPRSQFASAASSASLSPLSAAPASAPVSPNQSADIVDADD